MLWNVEVTYCLPKLHLVISLGQWEEECAVQPTASLTLTGKGMSCPQIGKYKVLID